MEIHQIENKDGKYFVTFSRLVTDLDTGNQFSISDHVQEKSPESLQGEIDYWTAQKVDAETKIADLQVIQNNILKIEPDQVLPKDQIDLVKIG